MPDRYAAMEPRHQTLLASIVKGIDQLIGAADDPAELESQLHEIDERVWDMAEAVAQDAPMDPPRPAEETRLILQTAGRKAAKRAARRLSADEISGPLEASVGRARDAVGPCTCECNSGGFCGGCGHAGCGRR